MALFNIFKKKKDEKKDKKTVSTKQTETVKATENTQNPKTEIAIKNINTKQETKSEVKAAPKKESKPAAKNTPNTEKKVTAKPKTDNSVKPESTSENKKAINKEETKPTEKKQEAPKAKAEPKKESTIVKKDEKPTEAKGYTGKFEINKSKDGKKFFFNLYASNQVGIATSQMYSSAQSALNGVNSVIANAPKAPIEDQSLKTYEELPYPKWEIYVDNGGKYRFRLSASNGNCVCHSQGYTTKTACKNGIDSIIRSSKNAEIDKTYIAKKDEK